MVKKRAIREVYAGNLSLSSCKCDADFPGVSFWKCYGIEWRERRSNIILKPTVILDVFLGKM